MKGLSDDFLDDETIVVNERGGKQSLIEEQPTEFPWLAFLEVSKVMRKGQIKHPREKDGTPNWYNLSCIENLDHGIRHAGKFLSARNVPEPNRDTDYMLEELSHAAARFNMALEQYLREGIR